MAQPCPPRPVIGDSGHGRGVERMDGVLVLYVVHSPVGLSFIGYGVILSMLAVGGLAGALISQPIQRMLGTRAVIAADVLAPSRCSPRPV